MILGAQNSLLPTHTTAGLYCNTERRHATQGDRIQCEGQLTFQYIVTHQVTQPNFCGAAYPRPYLFRTW